MLKEGFIKDIQLREFLKGKNEDYNDIKGIQYRFEEVTVHSEEINRPNCWNFSSAVPVLVVTSPCAFWLPSHIPGCLDGRAPTHKPDLFITGKFPRFHVSGKFHLPITSSKHLSCGDSLEKSPLESI